MPMIIILTGMKHTGKSTIGTQLARKTNARFVDTDALILERCGKTPRELYDEGGPELMAREEYEACAALFSAYAGPSATETGALVVATGGALAENPEALGILGKMGTLVYIDTPFEILFDRVMKSAERDGRLPKFLQDGDPREKFRELFLRRSGVYAAKANLTLLAGRRPPQSIIREILEKIAT